MKRQRSRRHPGFNSQRKVCSCCYGDGHRGPCCPGWLHMDSPFEVQCCDDCVSAGRRGFKSDDGARRAHARECPKGRKCEWWGIGPERRDEDAA
jgi:hypothetical protein